MSERRACRLVELDRSSYRYEPRADHNAELREELLKLARQKPRYAHEHRNHDCNEIPASEHKPHGTHLRHTQIKR